MTIVLPELEKAGCLEFTACSQVLDKAVLQRFSDKASQVAVARCGRLKRFVRLGVSKGGHLHLDVATPAYFAGGQLPKPTHSWAQIQGRLSPFQEERIRVRTVGLFSVPLDRLPESGLIKLLSLESKTPAVSIKLTGGTLSVTGAPIQRISWTVGKNAKQIEVRLQTTQNGTVSEMFLTDLFKLLNDSLHALVLGDDKRSNRS
jgi:hypothetical protein